MLKIQTSSGYESIHESIFKRVQKLLYILVQEKPISGYSHTSTPDNWSVITPFRLRGRVVQDKCTVTIAVV